ncbi:MAG TPA: twin-arginine translocase subunit TatC [Bacteroidia bacterium]|jgi:sec-independent protein translocase protein TatC|nr:twin-arginine translocase subunit TatC [Bacteroidia bacterium]
MADNNENISTTPKKKMSFLDHIEALRWHLIRSVIALLVITSILFFYSDFIFDTILFGPTKPTFITYRALCKLSELLHLGDALCVKTTAQFKIVNTEIWGQLTMYMWGTFIAGFILTMPYILWEVWRFISPALKPKEIRSTRGFVFAASFLFLLGVCFSYFIIIPWTVNFLGSFKLSSGTNVENLFNISSYVSTVTTLILWIGVIFELPMVTYILASIGIISSGFLKKYRKHSVVVVLIVAALIAPPDVASQVFISIPLYLLFEVSIFVAKYAEKRKATSN